MVHTLLLLLISSSISIIFSLSPLSLGLWVIYIAFLLTLFLSLYLPSWFAFLIFLIYIGGLLVIFSYFVAIQPNQYLGLTKLISASFFSFLYFFFLSCENLELLSFLSAPYSLSPVVTNANTAIILLLGVSLFIALIAVVKITYSSKAPLRPFIVI